MKKTERNTVIDFAKGATILLMLFDHIRVGGNFITSFHMPLFFILSGYFYKDIPLRETIIKKAKGLLIPYVVIDLTLSLIEIIKIIIIGGFDIKEELLSRLVGFVTGNNRHATWFFISLFLSHTIYAVIVIISKKSKILYAILVLTVSVGGYFISTPKLFLPYQIDLAMMCVLFISIGHMSHKYYEKVPSVVKYIGLAISLPIWIVGIYEGGIVLSFRYFPVYPLCVIAAICGTYVMMYVYKYLNKIPYFNTLIRWYGRNTITIMFLGCICLHSIYWGDNVFPDNVWVSFILQVIAITILIYIWEKIKGLFHNIKERNHVQET